MTAQFFVHLRTARFLKQFRTATFLLFNGCVLAALYLLWLPVGDIFARREESIRERFEVLSRYRDFLAHAGVPIGAGKANSGRAARPEYFSIAEDAGVLDARLQTVLKQKIEVSGARLYSAHSLPSKNAAGIRYVGVHLEIAGSIQSIDATIRTIESGLPYLFIDAADLSSATIPLSSADTGEQEVQTQFDVYGGCRSRRSVMSHLTHLLSRRLGLLVLITLNAIAFALVVRNWTLDLTPEASSGKRSTRIETSLLPPFKPILLASFQETTARPVFQRSRRPYRVPTPVAAKVAPTPAIISPFDPRMKLNGIFMIEGRKRAYIVASTGTQGEWIAEGEKFQGWTMRTIGTNSVTLVRGAEKFDLYLYGLETAD